MRRRIAWHSNPTPLWILPSSAPGRALPGRRRGKWRLLSSLLGYAVAVALTFLGLLAITFFIGRVVPIDPVLAVVGDRAPPAVDEAYAPRDGSRPAASRSSSASMSEKVLTGDFGTSVSTGNPVADDLGRVFPATLELATLGIIIGVVFGVPLGVFGGEPPGSLFDQVVRVVGLLGYSVPVFWLGLIGLLLFYAELQWVGGPGRLDVFYDDLSRRSPACFWSNSLLAGEMGHVLSTRLGHLMLPAVVLGYLLARLHHPHDALASCWTQLARNISTTARVKGVPERRVDLGPRLPQRSWCR